MIIRTAQLVLTVSDVESAVQAVRALVTATPGARILAAQTRYENDQQVATLTLQVPAAAFETVMSALRRLARRVESEATSSQDVTEEYIDLTARLRTLRATEARLLALLERAQRLEDILVLERELAQVRSQIERLEGRQRYLAQRSDLATITVTLQPEGLAARPQPPRPVWDPLQTAERAFQASLRLLLRLADLVITVLAFSWWLALLALLLAALWRRRRSAGLGASS
jgi:ABC-type anion transport system duplicated permease subunit